MKKASHMAYFFYAWVSYFIHKLSVSETDPLENGLEKLTSSSAFKNAINSIVSGYSPHNACKIEIVVELMSES